MIASKSRDVTGVLKALRAARVLLVEDDFLVGLDTEAQLIEAGFLVVGVAESADKAIAIAKEQQPELAIMDIQLVGPRDGIDAARALNDMGIPSLFATAYTDAETRRRGDMADPVGWLEKPYTRDSLVAALNRALPMPR